MKPFSFSTLLEQSDLFTLDEYVTNFGGIPEKVLAMFDCDIAKQTAQAAEEYLNSLSPIGLPLHIQPRQQLIFGDTEQAPELLQGRVAAIDGTQPLPMQKFTVGQALCAGIGSLSYTRSLSNSLHGYTSLPTMTEIDSIGDFLEMLKESRFGGINPTAYMRYYEVVHALEIDEEYIFFDGTLVYEWLANQEKGRDIYKKVLSQKKSIGVIKNLLSNVNFLFIGSVLSPGECVIVESVYQHLADNAKRQRQDVQWKSDKKFIDLSKQIFRGVFKPAKKAFGFECHVDWLPEMLRIMAADCQLNQIGHEIPFLLNLVDKEIRSFFKPNLLKDEIAFQMSKESEELFLAEADEHEFR